MAKTLIIVVADTVEFNSSDEITKKFIKKAVIFENYKEEDIARLKQIGGCKEAKIEELTEAFLEINPHIFLQVPHGNTAFAQIDDVSPRNTLIVVIAKNHLAMKGLGINSKIDIVQREIHIEDIISTICYIVDTHLPENPTGAIIYEVLKDPNLKATELGKAQQALTAAEEAMTRKARNPWDKHDCA